MNVKLASFDRYREATKSISLASRLRMFSTKTLPMLNAERANSVINSDDGNMINISEEHNGAVIAGSDLCALSVVKYVEKASHKDKFLLSSFFSKQVASYKVSSWKNTKSYLRSPLNSSVRYLSTSAQVISHGPHRLRGYSYIIIGAGTAGCVLANRLSEEASNHVLLLEAGPSDNSWKIHMPAALRYNLCNDKYNWFYHTDPEKGMNNRVMYWPRGRVLGGSSSLNAMVYIRGNALDYDGWESAGATGWSYADCLPYFKKSQTHEFGEDEYRGGSGPLHVSRGKTNHPLHRAFIDAAQQAGYPFTDDMNGYQQEGVGWMDMTIHQGKRWSAATAYLKPAMRRRNLEVKVKVLTTRILFEKNKAVGVEYDMDGITQTVYCEKEVILCGGAVNSPQTLMLSGIGNGDDLKNLEIPVVNHLPGVGENLQDHLRICIIQKCLLPITLYSAQWKFPHNMIRIGLQWFLTSTGYGATPHCESGGFIRSDANVKFPDIEFLSLPSAIQDHGRNTGSSHGYQLHATEMRPTSRGYIKLKSRDPRTHPRIVANYLTTEDDITAARMAVKLSRKIYAQKAFAPFRGDEIKPGDSVTSDRQIDEYIRNEGDSDYHPSCTCKMGQPTDSLAVVDPECRVIGTEGLRVVDASVMPNIISGNLNGPTIMIAEKAADIILGIPPLPKSNVPVFHAKTSDR